MTKYTVITNATRIQTSQMKHNLASCGLAAKGQIIITTREKIEKQAFKQGINQNYLDRVRTTARKTFSEQTERNCQH